MFWFTDTASLLIHNDLFIVKFYICATNSAFRLNLNINLNPVSMVHNDICNVKYRQIDGLHEPVLFEPLRQIRGSHAMFNVTSVIDFGPYLGSFKCLEKYIG